MADVVGFGRMCLQASKGVSFKGVKKLTAGKQRVTDEETKSVFTDYSMTSSILPRSERMYPHCLALFRLGTSRRRRPYRSTHLATFLLNSLTRVVMQLQDDRFEKFFEDEVGLCECSSW